MALTFANPIHVNGGLIFAPQDYVAAPSAFNGVGVLSALRVRGRFAGVVADNNGILSNASDPDGDPLSYRIVTTVSNGTLVTYIGGAFTYTPNPGFIGFDSFTYQVFAGGEGSNIATITLSVEGAFAGVAVVSRMRALSAPAALGLGMVLQAVSSTLRLHSAPASSVLGSSFAGAGVIGRMRMISAPATLSTLSATDFQAVISRVRLSSAVATLSIIGAGIPAITFQLGSAAEKKRRKKSMDEGTSAVLTIKFYDRGGVAVTPLSAKYQVDCPTTGTAVRTETALLAASQIALTLTAADNAIVEQSNVRELRRVTVEATLPGGDAVNAQYDYLVRNLSGVV